MSTSASAPLDLTWWEDQSRPCPRCGGPGRLLIVEITDQEAMQAVRTGMACLGDCCLDGLSPDRECTSCGHRW
jgi:hypothetical protein